MTLWIWLRGSSPLARGTLLETDFNRTYKGLIPARAGNTIAFFASCFSAGAHPRSRGEHIPVWAFFTALKGSSPLARGTLVLGLALESVSGLIPARAGNTMPTKAGIPEGRAHPRSRGEHITGDMLASKAAGSSPLARGTHRLPPAPSSLNGLIPARAGNTEPMRSAYQPRGAHPRSRGEHLAPLPLLIRPPGSSPLARGTPPF